MVAADQLRPIVPRLGSVLSILVISSILASLPISPLQALPHLPNPFDTRQCEEALSLAGGLYTQRGEACKAQSVLSEALLCIGLSHSDMRALDLAIAGFTIEATENRDEIFLRLYLAEALGARFPSSIEALGAFQSCAALLPDADLGDARPYLMRYLRKRIAEIRQLRQRTLDAVREGASAYRRGGLSEHQMGDWLRLMARTGPGGLHQAVEIMREDLMRGGNLPLKLFYFSELLDGIVPATVLLTMRGISAPGLCLDHSSFRDRETCVVARRVSDDRRVRNTYEQLFASSLKADCFWEQAGRGCPIGC